MGSDRDHRTIAVGILQAAISLAGEDRRRRGCRTADTPDALRNPPLVRFEVMADGARVIYRIDETQRLVTVIDIAHRRDAYRANR